MANDDPVRRIAQTYITQVPVGDAVRNVVLHFIDNLKQPHLYRYLPREDWAEDFVQGRLRLSTLTSWRTAEDGDKDEGTLTYYAGGAVGDGDNPEFQVIAARSSVRVAPGAKNITLAGSAISELHDGWGLSTTVLLDPDRMTRYGEFCIQIEEPETFFLELSKALAALVEFHHGSCGYVSYTGREYAGLETEPWPMPYLKPARYEPEQEWRMLWIPRPGDPVSRQPIDCPGLARFCKRIR